MRRGINHADKPKLTSAQLVAKMRDEKGIRFNIMDEGVAEKYLREHNNYFRTAAYRKNYPKYQAGPNAGKYIRLEFSYLCEISKLDMYLREILLQMCLDVEHALKVPLLADIEDDRNEDGYSVVDDFLAVNPNVKTSIAHTSGSSFTRGLVDKYFNVARGAAGPYLTSIDCPIWALTEVITFGDFARLYNFYYDRCGRTDRKLDGGIVNPVRTLRNACGHNSCMLFDLKEHTGKTHPGHAVTQFVAGVPGIGQRERRKKLSCRPLFEICCLLYAEQHYVTDEVRKNQMEKLKTFVDDRLFRHPEAFQESQIISTAFDFLRKMVDGCC